VSHPLSIYYYTLLEKTTTLNEIKQNHFDFKRKIILKEKQKQKRNIFSFKQNVNS